MSADPRLLRKTRTHLNIAADHLERAEAKLREAGLTRKAGTLERLARETAAQIGELPDGDPLTLKSGGPSADTGSPGQPA